MEMTLNNNFSAIENDELSLVNAGFSWRDVAVGGGGLLGTSISGPIGGLVGTVVGGAVYDFLT